MALKPGADKIALVAYASSRIKTPFELGGPKGEFEIWGCNLLYGQPDMTGPGKPYDRWFEVHDPEFLKCESPAHLTWLKKCQIPILMYEDYKDEIPSCLRFPIDDSIAAFGDYFSSTIAYMLAMALMECLEWAESEEREQTGMPFRHKKNGGREIYLYGIHMASDEEYHQQRACCEYYLGIARGTGVKFIIPEESSLLKTARRYGKHQGFDIYRLLDADKRAYQTVSQREKALAENHTNQAHLNAGVVQGIEMCMKKWFWDHEKKGIKSEEGQIDERAAGMDEAMCQALAEAVSNTQPEQSISDAGREVDALEISHALAQLSSDDIGILAVRIWQGLEWEQIAGYMNLTEEKTESAFMAAWEKLHTILDLTAGVYEATEDETGEADGTPVGEPDS